MLKWLKQKAQAAAANQCRLNIRLNVKHLVYAVENDGSIEKNQRDLAKDMALGIANGLSVEDVINESENWPKQHEVGTPPPPYSENM